MACPTLTTPDARALDVETAGEEALPLVLFHPGTPGGHALQPAMVDAAAQVDGRLAAFARGGYAGSTRRPGRTVADVVPDALAVVDALGADRFATVGASGGGPHALACGALTDRCVGVATVAGVGPFGAEDLDFLAGMGEGNEVEFGAALQGEEPLRALIEPWRLEMVSAGPQGTFDAMATVLSPPDQAVFSGQEAERMHASVALALRDGVDGWLDDDLAFVSPWGFDVADIDVPVLVWQGHDDRFVPLAHGEWLAAHIPNADVRLSPEDGHLTLVDRRVPEVHAWLVERFAG